MSNAGGGDQKGWPAIALSALGYFDKDDRLYPFIILCVFAAIGFGADPLSTALVGLGCGVAWPALRWLSVISKTYEEHHKRSIEWRLRANELAERHATPEELAEVRKSVDDFEQGRDDLR